MILKEYLCYASVDLKGDQTRGQMVLDKTPREYLANIQVVRLVDREFFKSLVLTAANNTTNTILS